MSEETYKKLLDLIAKNTMLLQKVVSAAEHVIRPSAITRDKLAKITGK